MNENPVPTSQVLRVSEDLALCGMLEIQRKTDLLVFHGKVRIKHVIPSIGESDGYGFKKLMRMIKRLDAEGGDAFPCFAS